MPRQVSEGYLQSHQAAPIAQSIVSCAVLTLSAVRMPGCCEVKVATAASVIPNMGIGKEIRIQVSPHCDERMR